MSKLAHSNPAHEQPGAHCEKCGRFVGAEDLSVEDLELEAELICGVCADRARAFQDMADSKWNPR